jgi:predicted ABC-type ATPase
VATKVVVLGACCSGKSSLCEQLRVDHRNVNECDEAVMLAAGGAWPASEEENHRLVIEAARGALAMTDVIFLTSWMPTEMLRLAHDRGFTVALLWVSMPELERRNNKRLAEGGYSDVAHWFESQLENYADLSALGLIDVVLDGTLTTAELASTVAKLASSEPPTAP